MININLNEVYDLHDLTTLLQEKNCRGSILDIINTRVALEITCVPIDSNGSTVFIVVAPVQAVVGCFICFQRMEIVVHQAVTQTPI